MRIVALLFICACLAGCITLPPPTAGGTPEAEAYSHYLASVMHQRQGQFEQAAEQLEAAVALAPHQMHLRLELIHTHIRLRDMDAALALCEETIEMAPGLAPLWLVKGWLHQQINQFERAMDAFQQAVSLQPDSVLGYEALVRVAEESNDLVFALEMYERLLDIRPDSPLLHFQYAFNLVRINDAEGARSALERALELNPGMIQARSLLGIVYLDLNQNAEAAVQFEQHLDAVPEDISSHEYLAGALARMKRYDDALYVLNELQEMGMAEPVHYVQRMYLMLRLGRYGEAAAEVPPNETPILGVLLRALAHKHNDDPFRRTLDTLDDIDGDVDEEASRYLVNTVLLFGKESSGPFFTGLLSDLEAVGVRSRVVQTLLARLYIAMERYEDAEDVLSRAITRFGSDKWLHYYMAMVLDSTDRRPETFRHLQLCMSLDPHDPDVLNFLGYMYAEENVHLEEAERLLNLALEMDPDNGYYLDSLGWIHYRKGDANRAIELIRRAIYNMRTDDAVLRDHLGDAYLLRGDVDKALAEWRRARRLDPELEGVQEKIDTHSAADSSS